MVYIIKKDGTKEEFDAQKIVRAVNKSAQRILYTFSQQEIDFICKFATEHVYSLGKTEIPISDMHNIVEGALEKVNPAVAKSYRDYRNYKTDFIHMMDEVYTKSQSIRYIGDKSNANTDSALVATKRSLIFNELNKELYRKFFMNRNELQACKDGYIYIHDQSARLDTMNCCLFDVGNVLKGGFEMGNVWYNEPKTLDTAFDVMGDIVLSTAAQQYGGFTVPEVDKILAPYAQKSYDYYVKEFLKYTDASWEGAQEKAIEYAIDKVRRECDQGWQGIEYKLNTVGSSRGDYPFVTVTLGLGTSMFEKMISISLLEVHKNGQGKKGHKKPVLFPKIVFLYDKAIHGEGGIAEDVFEAGLDCSSKTMYPDWLSMSGEGYIAEMYKKYKRVISPMGCRAFLSPWYERGGMEPADENDKPVFVGRFNIGAVSLHLPMILAKSRSENRDFHEVLDFYLEMIRDLHKRTYDYLGEMRASTNPLAYCEGGFYGGHLKPSDKIRPLLKPMTASFGITALNELQELYNGKSLVEDGQFALDTLKYINDKVAEFKKEQGIDLSGDKMAMQRIKEAAEKAKIDLSGMTTAQISLPFITADATGPKHMETTLSRAKFNEMTADLVEATMGPVRQAMSDSGLTMNDIDKILLVGGSTRIPAVQEAIKKFSGKEPFKGINPDECVAMGAALQGGVLGGDVKGLLLLDVTPLSLGIETMGGVNTVIIERNTTIPTKKSQIFSTAADNQTSVEVHVLQGEREFAKDNKTLGMFHLDGIMPARRGVPQIEVTFDIDSNGIVHVSAKDLGTGKEQHISITASSNMSKDDIDKAVKEAEQFAAEDKKKREAVDLRNNADQMVYQTEKLLSENGDKFSDDDKSALNTKLDALKEALKGDNTDAIKSAEEDLTNKFYEVSQKIYEATQGAQGPQPGAAPGADAAQGGNDAGYTDADYTEVDDN